jgi:hypothetical protein
MSFSLDLALGEWSKSHREAVNIEVELGLEGEAKVTLEAVASESRSSESDKLDSHIELCQSRHGR